MIKTAKKRTYAHNKPIVVIFNFSNVLNDCVDRTGRFAFQELFQLNLIFNDDNPSATIFQYVFTSVG